MTSTLTDTAYEELSKWFADNFPCQCDPMYRKIGRRAPDCPALKHPGREGEPEDYDREVIADVFDIARRHVEYGVYQSLGIVKTYDCHRCYALAGARCKTMLTCERCGCKRCPHASDHRLDCARSNEPGQPGSIYGVHIPLRDGEEWGDRILAAEAWTIQVGSRVLYGPTRGVVTALLEQQDVRVSLDGGGYVTCWSGSLQADWSTKAAW